MEHLIISDSEVSEIVRFTQKSGGQQPLPPPPSTSIPWSRWLEVLEGRRLGSERLNELLSNALHKVSDHVLLLTETWKANGDPSLLALPAPAPVDAESVRAVLNFVDKDKGGTLDLQELAQAIRAARRFDLETMLMQFCLLVVRVALPRLRALRMPLPTFVDMMNNEKTQTVTPYSIGQCLLSIGLPSGPDVANDLTFILAGAAGGGNKPSSLSSSKTAAAAGSSNEDAKARGISGVTDTCLPFGVLQSFFLKAGEHLKAAEKHKTKLAATSHSKTATAGKCPNNDGEGNDDGDNDHTKVAADKAERATETPTFSRQSLQDLFDDVRFLSKRSSVPSSTPSRSYPSLADASSAAPLLIDDVLHAFSDARRVGVSDRMQARGKALLKKLHGVVLKYGMEIDDWFNSMDLSWKKEAAYDETDSEEDDEELQVESNASSSALPTIHKVVQPALPSARAIRMTINAGAGSASFLTDEQLLARVTFLQGCAADPTGLSHYEEEQSEKEARKRDRLYEDDEEEEEEGSMVRATNPNGAPDMDEVPFNMTRSFQRKKRALFAVKGKKKRLNDAQALKAALSVARQRPTGALSTYELRSGFKRMAESDKTFALSETDVTHLMRYVDPNGDGDVTFDELENAVLNIYETSEEEKRRREIYEDLNDIEDILKRSRIVLSAFFRKLDKDGTGVLTKQDFVASLLAVQKKDAESTLNLERWKASDAMKKNKVSKSSWVAIQAKIHNSEQAKRNAQYGELVALEKSGAGPVLRKIAYWVQDRGMTISTLIQGLDKNGDGSITYDEMIDGIIKFMEPSTRTKATRQKKLQKEAEKKRGDISKQLEAHRLKAQMIHAEACGAINALTALESFMRKNCLRVKDLFDKIDLDGSGGIDAHELRKALKKCGLFLTKSDVKGLVAYLDTSHDGSVEVAELEDAIKMFRKYSWQKNEVEELLRNVAPIPLVERCQSLPEVFNVRGNPDDMLTAQAIIDGLLRMRGDKDARLWLMKDLDADKQHPEGQDKSQRSPPSKTAQNEPSQKSLANALASATNKVKTRESRLTVREAGGTKLPSLAARSLASSMMSDGSVQNSKGPSSNRSNPRNRPKGVEGGGGADSLFGGQRLYSSLPNNFKNNTPSYVDRLYNLNDSSAYRALQDFPEVFGVL